MPAKVAWFERDQPLIRQFTTGVSIHSHTSRSKESLEFVGRILASHPLLRTFLHTQNTSAAKHGIRVDLTHGYWTPPLCPRSAYEVEKGQIEQNLGMQALVSLSDHDCIDAPLILRVVPAMDQVPVSLEWTVPFQTCKFHLGIHNLPDAQARPWLDELKACTAEPGTERICDLLRTLHAIPGVLIVFNHPLWNLYANSPAEFAQNLEGFLALNNAYLHAFELNGMRRWEENLRVCQFAGLWQQLLVSGGDRHGCEPNANLNLTRATSFDEWVHELRVERRSQLLFMPQYDCSFVARCYQTFLDAIRHYPDHSEDLFGWDQRTYHPGREGAVQPISELWKRVPPILHAILGVARLAESTRLLDTVRTRSARAALHMPALLGREENA